MHYTEMVDEPARPPAAPSRHYKKYLFGLTMMGAAMVYGLYCEFQRIVDKNGQLTSQFENLACDNENALSCAAPKNATADCVELAHQYCSTPLLTIILFLALIPTLSGVLHFSRKILREPHSCTSNFFRAPNHILPTRDSNVDRVEVCELQGLSSHNTRVTRSQSQ